MTRYWITALLAAASLDAQGFYTTYQIDGGSYIQTDAIGYGGPSNCGGGSISLWNSFNGNYAGGSTGLTPLDVTSGSSAVDNVEYAWQYGYSFEYYSPYGYCTTYNASFWNTLGFAITITLTTPWYARSDANGFCTSLVNACTNTDTPRCPVTKIQVGGPGLYCLNENGGSYYETLVFIWNGACQGGPSIAAPYPGGYCTPKNPAIYN